MVNRDYKDSEISSGYSKGQLDSSLIDLSKSELEVINLQKNARLRLKTNQKSIWQGNFVQEGVLMIPKKGFFLVRSSPILKNAKEAVKQMSVGLDYFPTEREMSEALVESIRIQGRYIDLTDSEDCSGNFCFGESFQGYAQALTSQEIFSIPIWLPDMIYSIPFARQLYFSGIEEKSVLTAINHPLDSVNRLRGIGLEQRV